ncbi:uncharacterized protein C8A04DRAFT_15044 [Dichotomopilus funicola]|uniref:USP domain-containing protein n=1 Tax=Dichotomopilus funicola TaxID=1934379 RepID=A0AAN6UW68_9PEZI|nr:hypothetical protein C8A04DRAFT_15044 [Dichotomopilus funicola]
MAQAPSADPRERAISSEPCSTRPNPFDDQDVLSRKRRRTSLASDSRSRSAETLDSSPSSPVVVTSTPELPSDSAMKIDSEPIIPTTPERQQRPAVEPTSEQRSSRVTINVRTPSRPLEAIPPSPPSPSPDPRPVDSTPLSVASSPDVVKTSVEEADSTMPINGESLEAPTSPRSDSDSPPVEVVSVNDEDDADFDDDDESITMLDEPGRSLEFDPSQGFPFHDATESYFETVVRLLQYLPTHEQVPRSFIDWIDKYVSFVRTASPRAIDESYLLYRDMWQSVPQLILHMVNRKSIYPRSKELRHEIFSFYRSFARLTAIFLDIDLRIIRNPSLDDQARLQALASPPYIHALGALTRREEVVMHSSSPHFRNGDEDWSYISEVLTIIDAFQTFPSVQGGSLYNIRQLAALEARVASQAPRLAMDHLGNMCLISGIILKYLFRTAQYAGQPLDQNAARTLGRMYAFFNGMSAIFSEMVDKSLNQLSPEGSGNLIEGLTEVYQTCLSVDGAVPAEIFTRHFEAYPKFPAQCAPEAISLHWKFTHFVKLIRSGQMQLRVMAVSTMCSDLVALYRKNSDPLGEESTAILHRFVADFLLSTGLVTYILGPTCHPEITLESSNIIGFLVVTQTYLKAHTDILWQTVTSTQDPRVSDALLRMIGRIANLYAEESLMYFLEKLSTVPVESFGAGMREFCDQVLKQILTRFPDSLQTESTPFDLFIRLIRHSSKLGSQSQVAYPDIQQFAIQKFDILLGIGPGEEGRVSIYLDCLADIAAKSPFTLGSLWVLKLTIRQYQARDMHRLTSQHELSKLLVDELAAAIPAVKAAGFSAALSGPQNAPRKDMIISLIFQEPTSITEELGPKLWNLLVGPEAACQEDRDSAWQSLSVAIKRSMGENPFALLCFAEYLPKLDPKFFCKGTLEFVKEGVLPLVDEPNSIILDDDENPNHSGIEKLWRVALTAPKGTVETDAIHALANDVYIESRSIQSFPPYRARKVHLALVDRCLRQLSSAATKLKSFANGVTTGDDDDSMAISASDEQVQEQELLFSRSLAILREFHNLHKSRPEFAAPYVKSLMLETPKEVEGELAELKYQSFDGTSQTKIMPLAIGKRNTAASLLASLRDVTGFDSYRIYYRGRPFVPRVHDICRSLEDLRIENGLILVKKEAEGPASPRVPQGASPVEIEILSHFEELWDYLSLDEKLSREIYGFLIKLPADVSILEAIANPAVSYADTFSLGQPLKSLYAVHALREYLDSWRPKSFSGLPKKKLPGTMTDTNPSLRSAALIRAMSLVVSAISDPQIVAQCPTQELQIDIGSSLVALFVSLLQEPELPALVGESLDGPLLERLLAILSVAATSTASSEIAIKHISLCLQGLLESCCKSDLFMAAFTAHPDVPRIVGNLLLHDSRDLVRQTTAILIRDKTSTVAEGERLPVRVPETVSKFREFFWPLISQLVRPAMANPANSTDTLDLCFDMLQTLEDARTEIPNLKQLSNDWFLQLLRYTTFEDLTKPAETDMIAAGMIRLVHVIVCRSSERAGRDILPSRGMARKIFWKHLFPPRDEVARAIGPSQPIACPQTRGWLMEIIFTLVKDDPTQYMWLLEDMDELVPVFFNQDGEHYAYELPQQFDRSKAIRAACGYSGLRNLSNTCYFNSLLTQLFMNVDFREFMLGATVRDRQYGQNLLFQTQKLFAFMQESVRPFINPEECVASIKTYEDTQIDIVIQMDVDEFYNLLFDRWEGQFVVSDEKNRFRAFYGGQLVQQVRSQECEHVSERLEPFSAIQCDIKGKTSLEESLQAYVDGEIMEGDNKYKCSTCDRHVDAVKRACLKDIPDNLIFHLKRFDFNLRTMQRSKINDYFAFPDKIDMRPYTIDHLSSPDEEKPEDVFELVGVLVHTGTAESGHYYSYIRERPSSGEVPTWVEFNDETVTPWDPASMANSCFGGQDYQPQFQANSAVFEKQYSAYMLFYQRSSSLAKNQALQSQGCSIPLGVKMPEDMHEFIQDENAWLLRRHCLFDPSQIQFVSLALFQLKTLNSNRCSADHTLEGRAIAMALSHLDQIASRTKDVPDFYALISRLQAMCESCSHCGLAVHDYFTKCTFAFRMLVQRNLDEDVRQATASFYIQVLRSIKEQDPAQYYGPELDVDGGDDVDELDPQASVIGGVIHIMEHLWQGFHMNLRSWQEVFDFMLSFVRLGRQELSAFLQHQSFFKWLLWIIWADTNAEPFLPPQFAKLVNVIARRTPNRPPAYETIIGLLDFVLAHVRLLPSTESSPEGTGDSDDEDVPTTDPEPLFEVPAEEARILQRMGPNTIPVNIFVDRLITISQNQEATHSIIANLMKQNVAMESSVFHTLVHRITGQIGHHVAPYLHIAGTVFCRVSRSKKRINDLVQHISRQCRALNNAEGKAFLQFQREIFDGPRERTGQTPHEVIMDGLDNIPEWAPGLLGYFDTSVVDGTEVFLQERIFQYRTFQPPPEEETEESRKMADKLKETARSLGLKCLYFLRDTYVARNADVSERAVIGLQRVIKICSRYFNLKEPTEDPEATNFMELSQSVMDALAGLMVVDELEEDGSGMYYSDDSSVASSNTAG